MKSIISKILTTPNKTLSKTTSQTTSKQHQLLFSTTWLRKTASIALLGSVLMGCTSSQIASQSHVQAFQLAFNSAQMNGNQEANSWSHNAEQPLCRLSTQIEMRKAFTQTAQQNKPANSVLPAELQNKPYVTLQLQDKNKQRYVNVSLVYQAESSEVWLMASLDNGKNEYLARTQLVEQIELELLSRPQGDYVLSFATIDQAASKQNQSSTIAKTPTQNRAASHIREHAMKMNRPAHNIATGSRSSQRKAAEYKGEQQLFDFYPDFAVQSVNVQNFAANTTFSPLVIETGC